MTKMRSFFDKKIWKYRYLYLMILPGFISVFVFNYMPMYGIQIAFRNFSARAGIWNSPWVGLQHFQAFFNSPLALRAFTNTLILGIYTLLWSFPMPIILALLLNELRSNKFRRFMQTVTYFPHFISIVVVVGMMRELLSRNGIVNRVITSFGQEPVMFMLDPAWFRTIFIGSGIWQGVGFASIIYLAALSNADPTLYDVADIDGANRFQKVVHISWQAIKPTTIILLIFSLGGILGNDFQRILLMYHPGNFAVSDVIGTFVFRMGLEGGRFEFATAVGLFMSVISFVLLVIVNAISRKVSETSLW